MAGLHTGIGGHVDNHELEEIESCVYRELEEETGITRDDIYDLKYRATILHSVQDKGDWVMYCYTALTDKASELPLHTPDGELLRYDTDKLESLALTSLTKLCHDKIFASEAPRFVGGMRHHDCEGKCCMVYE